MVLSTVFVGVNVIETEALLLADTKPAASFAQAKSVLLPAEENVYDVGFEEVQPVADAEGGVELSVTIKPVTATSSVAVSVVKETTRVVDVAGIANAVTVGAVFDGVVTTGVVSPPPPPPPHPVKLNVSAKIKPITTLKLLLIFPTSIVATPRHPVKQK
jgi:hypothetical protein